MTYVCLGEDPNEPGSNLYEVTMIVYRDCFGNGADFDSTPGPDNPLASVTIYKGTSDVPYIWTIYLGAPIITEIDPSFGNNPCLIIPPNVCAEQGIYTFEVSLPITDENYQIVYQRCCRNESITNIETGFVGSTYSVTITPKAQSECNNSPVFNSFPPPVICVNRAINFDHSAFDAEGDQIVYEFCSPLLGGEASVVAPNPEPPPPYEEVEFVLPFYTPLNPLGVSTDVAIDPVTGMITGTPTIQGRFVVGVCVQEFRNGELLSVIQRDFQFNVSHCEPLVNADPGGILIAGNHEFYSCVDSTINFFDQSTGQQYIEDYYWEFDLESSNSVSFTDKDVTVTFPGPGIYNGMLILNRGDFCTDTADIKVTIAPPVTADFTSSYDTCVAGPVEFIDKSIPGGYEIVDWLWDFDDGNITMQTNPTHQFEAPGLRNIKLIITDEFGCRDTAYQEVDWFPVPPLIIVEPSSFVGCPPLPVLFENLSSPIDSTYEIVWDFGDGGFSSEISPNYTFEKPGLFDIKLEITSPIGCYTSSTFEDWIFIDSTLVADFTYAPDLITSYDPRVNFTDNSLSAASWNWTFDDYGTSIAQNPSFVFPDTGLMEVELVVTHFYGCKDTILKIVDVQPEVKFFLPNAFTPNQDAKNEQFKPKGQFYGIRDYEMKILNRWGEIIFQANDPAEGWNGRVNNTGKICQSGVYVYMVTFTGPRGEKSEYKGFATLVK